MLVKTSSTYQLQKKLSDQCKTGRYAEINGSKKEGILKYQELVFFNIEDTLRKTYPITFAFLRKENWIKVVRAFFENYPIPSPFMWEMPKYMWDWAKEKKPKELEAYPFIEDLLHFEWLELEFYITKNLHMPAYINNGHPLEDVLVFNPEKRAVHLNYPVFRKKLSRCTDKKGNYFLMVWRKHPEMQVRYLELSPFYLLLVETMEKFQISAAEALPDILEKFQLSETNEVLEGVCNFLITLVSEGIVLGYAT